MKTKTYLNKISWAATQVLCTAIVLSCGSPSLYDSKTVFSALSGGGSFSLTQAKATQLVINFFAPDCPPCIKELPELQKFYEVSLTNPSIEFISIGSALESVAAGEDITVEQARAAVSVFAKENNLVYPIYLADTKQLRSWGITGFPETFLFKKNQKDKWQLKQKFISEVKSEQLTNALNEPEAALY